MATDYDAPRKPHDGVDEDETADALSRRDDKAAGLVGLDASDNEPLDLPAADLSGEELTVRVLPRQADEFICSRCFLVQHRSQLARRTRGRTSCRDCS
jgi:hypothetical protein